VWKGSKKEEIYSPLPTSRQMSSDFPGSRPSVHIAVASEDKRCNHECPSLLLSPPTFIAKYDII